MRGVRPPLAPRSLSTVRNARAGSTPRQQIRDKRQGVTAFPPDDVEGTVQQNVHVESRRPRYSISDARPGLYSDDAYQVTDPSITTRALSSFIRIKGSHTDNPSQRVFLPPWKISDKEHGQSTRLSPLGTRPRSAQPEDLQPKGHIGEEGSQKRTQDLESQKESISKQKVPSSMVAEAGSLAALRDLPLHPDLLQTIADKPELYGETPLEATAFHRISSGRDVYIRQKNNANPAYLLPIVQKLVSNDDGASESTIVASASLLRHIPKTRPISALILSPSPKAANGIRHTVEKLLKKFPHYSVCTAILGQRPSHSQRRILDRCDILVANPHVLVNLLHHSDLKDSIRGKLMGLQIVVVERASSFLHMPAMQDVHEIISQLSSNGEGSKRAQRVLASATHPTGSVAELVGAFLAQPYYYVDAWGKRQVEMADPKTKSHGPKGVEKHGKRGQNWNQDGRGDQPSRRNEAPFPRERIELPQAENLA
ncbi:hypothetical protein VPNG_08545 [Cytospora leucostoma]|uniref:ATP-dependent RNA helicase n=1 Tax=Cytospora leucostoma TaxID=1230097 RepID=A0A423W527_9PEZI|nr:hypothetical protein VPNG_08545 [Cytospora leucostoma]